MLLLSAFRDLWNEWGDSKLSDLFTELLVPAQVAGVVGTLKCALYIILSTTVSFFLPLRIPYYFYKVSLFVCVHFHYFCKYTLHVHYVFNVILRLLLMTDGLNTV